MLRVSSVRSGRVLLADTRFMADAETLMGDYSLRDGDLLFTRYNGSIDLLGVCGMVRGLGSRVLLYPDKLMRVRFDHPFVVPEYAEVFFQSSDTRDRVVSKAKSTAGQHGVSGGDLKGQPFALPPLPEQREIVKRVAQLLALANAVGQRVLIARRRVECLHQAVLAKAFQGELVPTEAGLARREGREYEPAEVLLERIRREGEGREPAPCASRERSSRER